MYSATQLFIFSVLQIINIDVCLFAFYLMKPQQKMIIQNFTHLLKNLMILMSFYMINSVKLNLQNLCWHVALFDSLFSQSIDIQAVDHTQHLENSSNVVHVMKIYNKDTFNDCLNKLNVRKMLSEMMTELNRVLFCDEEKETDNNVYNENVNLEHWVLFQDTIHAADSNTVTDLSLFMLKLKKLLQHLIKEICDHHVIIT